MGLSEIDYGMSQTPSPISHSASLVPPLLIDRAISRGNPVRLCWRKAHSKAMKCSVRSSLTVKRTGMYSKRLRSSGECYVYILHFSPPLPIGRAIYRMDVVHLLSC